MAKENIKVAANQNGETARKISGDTIQAGYNLEINTNEFQVGSALQTMFNRAQQFKAQQAQNDNTPEGDNPPPGGNASEFSLPAIDTDAKTTSQPLSVADVLVTRNLTSEQLSEIIENSAHDNLFPEEKLLEQALYDKVNELREWVDEEVEKLKQVPFSLAYYKKRKAIVQARASYMLILECFIGEQLKKLKKLKRTKLSCLASILTTFNLALSIETSLSVPYISQTV